MKAINIGICDDEAFWIDHIRKLLLTYVCKYNRKIEIRTFSSAEEYLQETCHMDILLLDVEMEKVSGIDLKNLLASRMQEIAIIFVSSYGVHMPEAFGKNVYGYVSKPVMAEKLYEKLDIILEEKESTVEIQVNGSTFILSSDILYVKAINNYVEIHTAGQVHVGYFSLKECEEKLPPSCFKRVQKSFIVNYEYIVTIKDSLVMEDGFKIRISRGKATEIKEGYISYVRKRARD